MVSRFDILERKKIIEWSQFTLWNKEGEIGLNYLIQERKLKKETIKKFNLGFVPPDVNHQLANRIIFPIFDSSNHLIAICSRLIHNEKSDLPIYWHEEFNKSFYLYGMNLSKESIRNKKYTIITEGNFDVIKCHDEGLFNVVGLLGSTISDIQLSVILRYCENVIFIFDNDENLSGQKGSAKTKKKIEQYSSVLNSNHEYKNASRLNLLNSYFVSLPNCNTDPDSFIRKHGISSLKSLVRKGIDSIKETNV